MSQSFWLVANTEIVKLELFFQFTKFFPQPCINSIRGNGVREIHQHKDKNGNLWIGTEDAGLTKFNSMKILDYMKVASKEDYLFPFANRFVSTCSRQVSKIPCEGNTY